MFKKGNKFGGWNKNLTKETDVRVKNIADKMKGKEKNITWRENLSKARTGTRLPQTWRDNISKGKLNTYKSDDTKLKISKSLLGKPKKESTISKLRIIAQNNIINKGKLPRTGFNEIHILNQLEELFRLKILRQYPVNGYFLDGYIPELNLAIEVDEKSHSNIYRKQKDIQREGFIKQQLNCDFLRIEDKYGKN